MSDLLNSASLVMIPSGYKEDVVYSQIPTDGAGDLSFTRASNGTRINSAGLVEVVPWNLVGYSEDFSDAYWNKNNSPVMAYNVATAPNGTMTADSIQSNITSFYQSVGAPSLSIAPNSTVTLSIYIKKETSKTYFGGSYLYFTGGTAKLTYVIFDEVNGIINIVAPDQVSMVTSVESVGDWWRFIVTGTDTGSNTSLDFAFYGTLSQNGTTLDTGIGSARTIWGAQVNIGSTAKPYFPTTDRLNVPRLTYQNGGGGCPSLLLEKQSTNSFTYSEQFDNADWVKISPTTVTANTATSPDGTTNADSLNSTTSTEAIYQISASGTITFSVYAKAGTSTSLQLASTISFNGRGADFNLSNGTASAVYQIGSGDADINGGTSSIVDVGNGWYRCIISGLVLTASRALTIANNNGNLSYLWGAQLEASSYPTSYIPTTSSTATRVADACFKTGISSLIGQSQGTIFIDFVVVGIGSNAINIYNNERAATTISTNAIIFQTNGTIECQTFLGNGGFGNIVLTASTYAVGQRIKLAFRYKSGDFALYVNGVQKDTDTGTLTFVGTKATIELDNNSVYYAYQEGVQYNQLVQFTTALTNSELQAISTI